jgi:hypothetical protein
VDLLVPELQRRGIMWDDYAVPNGTFRENLLGHRHLAEDHYGAKFKFGRDLTLLKTRPDENVKPAVTTNGSKEPETSQQIKAESVNAAQFAKSVAVH